MGAWTITKSEHWQPQPRGHVGSVSEAKGDGVGFPRRLIGLENQRRWQGKQLAWPQPKHGTSIVSGTSPQMTQEVRVGSG